MKKVYQNPEIELNKFRTADIITFSKLSEGHGDELDYGLLD
ncbi:MAG: hypothetical protein ACI3XQ_11225 [Eubacteriales bacterium]